MAGTTGTQSRKVRDNAAKAADAAKNAPEATKAEAAVEATKEATQVALSPYTLGEATKKENADRVKDGTIVSVPFAQIRVLRGLNPRDFDDFENKKRVEDLANIIRDDDRVIQPIEVSKEADLEALDGTISLVAQNGETRLRALEILHKEDPGKWANVEVMLRDSVDKKGMALLFLSTSNTKAPTLWEQLEVVRRLRPNTEDGKGWTWDEIADVMHVSRPHLLQNVKPLDQATAAMRALTLNAPGSYGYLSASDLAKKIRERLAGKSKEQFGTNIAALEKQLLRVAAAAEAEANGETNGDSTAKGPKGPSAYTQWKAAFGGDPAKDTTTLLVTAMREVLTLTNDEAIRKPIVDAFAALNIPHVNPIAKATEPATEAAAA